jgi:hypothetical protein
VTTGAGGSGPVDLRALRATDALLDRLCARAPDPAGDQDAAVRLLRALLEDVSAADESSDGRRAAGPSPAVVERSPAATRRSGGSLGVRAAVAVGVASAVLAAGGVAAGWNPGEDAGAGIKSGPVLPEPDQDGPPDSRPSSLSITPST